MAKHCDVCNKSYPDTDAYCPHCAAAEVLDLGDADLDEPALAEEASQEPAVVELAEEPVLAESDDDSAVDLGEPLVADLASSSGSPVATADPASGASDIAWSALVEDADAAPSAKVDSPSDVDLLAHVPPDNRPAVPSDSAVGREPFIAEVASGTDLPGPAVAETPPPAPAGDSAVGREPFVAEVASSEDLTGAPSSEVNLADGPRLHGAAPSDVALASEAAEQESSAIDLGSLTAKAAEDSAVADVVELADSSAVHLGEEPIFTAESSPSPADLAALATEAEIAPESAESAGAPAGLADEGPDTQFLDDLAAVEAGSAVNLGEASRSSERSSSRDLIAEAVESGVALGEAPPAAAEEEAEGEAVLAEEDDSAVDLGSVLAEGSPSSGPEALVERNVPPGSHHDIDLDAEPSSDRVDLGAPADEEEAEVAEDEAEVVGPAPDSSGVDLGGSAARPPTRRKGEPSSHLDLDDLAADARAGADSGAEVVPDAEEEPAAAELDTDEDEEPTAAVAEDEEQEEMSGRRKRTAAALDDDDEEAEASALLAGGDEEAEAEAEAEVEAKAEEDEAEAEAEAEEDEAPAKTKRRPVAEDDDEDEPSPRSGGKAAPKARSGCGCLLVGSFLGLLVGVGSAFGLWLYGIEPPTAWKLAQSKPPVNTGRAGGAEPKPGTGPEAQAAAANPGRDLNNGEFAKVVTDLASAPDPTPEVQAQRGTARWMKYLQEQMGKNAPLKADDEEVKKASEDLQAAAQKDNPEAILSLGNLQENTGRSVDALKTYQDGLKKFAEKPAWARAFQAQIDRLESLSARPAEGGKPGARGPRLDEDRDVAARALVALLIAFQGDQPAPPAGGNDAPAEAGYDFWAAVKASQNGDYDAALKALKAAREKHDTLRFSRLRKAQNPLSDPTEQIFLRSVKEIEAYWTVQKDMGGDLKKAIDALVKAKKDALAEKEEALAKVKDQIKEATDKLVKEKEKLTESLTALEKELDTAKKDLTTARKEAKDLNEKLTTADKDLTTANDKLTKVAGRLEAAGIKGPDLPTRIDTLANERNAADKTITAVVEKIALAHVKVPRKDVLQGVNRVVETALINDPRGELMASRDEIKRLGGVLSQRRTPQEMLDVWLPILADRAQKEAAPKATVDADLIRNDEGAPPAAKRKALAVLGLAQRNLGDFDAARSLLADALAGNGPKPDWQPPVAQALKELTDPAAYYLPRARGLYEDGKNKEAMDVLAEAIKLFPKEKEVAVLLPLRSLVQLDQAREKGNGKVDANDARVAAARKDAQTAAAAGDAEGHYALGLIEEELGHLAEAKANYAKALAAHADNDEAGARYRLALARVLKLQGDKKPRVGRADPARGHPVADVRRQPLLTLLLLVEVGMQPGGPDQDEAAKLLEEVLNAKDGPDTFMLKAQAQALRGLWTPALKTYAAGLRAHLRRDYADGLADLIERHPALRRPSSMDPPNPLLAEGSYATGLRHYFARKYTDAEAAFAKAIEYDNQDARYFYFLGLSRLALDKRTEAQTDFQEGAQLERQNRPGREAVSTALERVQGTARQAVNKFRP